MTVQGGDILDSVLEDGGAVWICFSGVIDVASVGAGEVVVADFRGSWWLVGVGRSACD